MNLVLKFAFLFSVVAAQHKLPDYIKTCSIKSSDFQKCALEHANDAIPYIVKGDRHLGIPKLDPLQLPLLEITHTNLNLTLRDVTITGLKDVKAKNLKIGRTAFEGVFHIENLNILGKYHINGKVLLLTLLGDGLANLTAVGGDYTVKAALTPYSRNGHTYLKFEKPDVQFKLQRAHFDFTNLLSDDRLSAEINQVLNESWEEILNDVGAPIRETISSVSESIVSNILGKVPEQYIFPE